MTVIGEALTVALSHYLDNDTTLQARLTRPAGGVDIDWTDTDLVQTTASGDGPNWWYEITFDSTGLDPGVVVVEWRRSGTPATVWIDDDEITLTAAPVVESGEAIARERLERLLSPAMEPVLAEADIDDLMLKARRPDTDGLLPADDDWTPTYTTASIDAAASEGWEIRAGRCFDDINFAEDGQQFSASKRHDACVAMAKLYRRGTGSVQVPSMAASVADVAAQ